MALLGIKSDDKAAQSTGRLCRRMNTPKPSACSYLLYTTLPEYTVSTIARVPARFGWCDCPSARGCSLGARGVADTANKTMKTHSTLQRRMNARTLRRPGIRLDAEAGKPAFSRRGQGHRHGTPFASRLLGGKDGQMGLQCLVGTGEDMAGVAGADGGHKGL